MASTVKQEYDIIIVGAGTSGCVLANRLSEDANVSILIIEAGENRNDDEKVYTPQLGSRMLRDPQYDWCYESVADPGLNGRTMKHPRGKMVGGTSAINSFALIYPSKAGMDVWADLTGDESWGWNAMEKYFRKFQRICPPSEEVRRELAPVHTDAMIEKTQSGFVEASFPLRVIGLQKAWVETWKNLGLECKSDPLEGNAVGGHTSTCHISGGRHERSHAGVAFLEPAMKRGNVTLLTGALVKKVGFEKIGSGAESVARSVVYLKGGVEYEVQAMKEIILAAGTFNTPQLLELSGIGDPEILKKHGIDMIHANKAVGENLQDHIRPGISWETAEGVPSSKQIPPEEARALYEKDRSGPWAEQACFAFSYTPLVPFLGSDEKGKLKVLLDMHLGEDPSAPNNFLQHRNKYIRKVIESENEATAVTFLSRKPAGSLHEDVGQFITLFAMLSHPFSAGSVHISSADPAVHPEINFNYYSHPLDLEIHALHVLAMQKIAATEPLASFIKPGGERLPKGSDPTTIEGAKAMTKEYVQTNYHPCGSCSLGEVVDSKLKVKGVSRLRIVDASVFPIIPRGNIITTVYAVAERAADVVSGELGIRRIS